MTGNTYGAMQAYQSIGMASSVASADPHQLISMLMQGVLDCVARARGALDAGRIAEKGEQSSRAIAVLETLRACLDHSAGADVSTNLDRLYEYMSTRLLLANAANDAAGLDEVAALMREIKAGWDEIPEEARAMRPADAPEHRLAGSSGMLGSC